MIELFICVKSPIVTSPPIEPIIELWMKEAGTLLDASNAILYGESRLLLMNPNPKYAPSAAPPIGSPKPSLKTKVNL